MGAEAEIRRSGWPPGRIAAALALPATAACGLWLAGPGARLLAFLPPCGIHATTGMHCPGCGGTRAFHALARGDLAGAVAQNVFGVIFLAAMALVITRCSWEAWFPSRRWPRLPISGRVAWGILGAILLFAILRNLPWWPWSWLAPRG